MGQTEKNPHMRTLVRFPDPKLCMSRNDPKRSKGGYINSWYKIYKNISGIFRL